MSATDIVKPVMCFRVDGQIKKRLFNVNDTQIDSRENNYCSCITTQSDTCQPNNKLLEETYFFSAARLVTYKFYY